VNRRLVVLLALLASSIVARADVPTGIAKRVVRFAFDGCDYLNTITPNPDNPGPLDKKLAAHFGKITKSQADGIRIRYELKTARFDGWSVSYWARGVDIEFPASVSITMSDLQQLLGPDEAQDVDYVASTTTTTAAKNEVETREFNPKRDGYCYVTVRAEANRKKGAERRVFSLRFAD
jgi:hypothetical protein